MQWSLVEGILKRGILTSQEEFTRKIEASQQRLEELIHQEEVEQAIDSNIKIALEELQVLSEELLIADAELREQNDELARSRDALEMERLRYQDLFEFAPDGYLVTDRGGKILEANNPASRLLNVESQFLLNKPFAVYIAPEDRRKFRIQLEQIGLSRVEGQRIEDWELRLQPRDQEPFFVSLTAQVSRDGIRWLVRDIRLRKQMQAELDEVQRRLVEGREQERLHLAKLLHDGPLQALYGQVFRLNALTSPEEGDGNLEEISAVRNGLQEVIDMLRALLGDMRPPSLTPFGLEKAIHSHAENFHQAFPEIKIYLDLIPDKQVLPEKERLALFRIYQQSLLNVAQHAQANLAWVRLTFDDHRQVRLEIQDNGKGFDVPENWLSFVRDGRLGLARLAEQAASIGGKLAVESQPGKGTTVRVTAPID